MSTLRRLGICCLAWCLATCCATAQETDSGREAEREARLTYLDGLAESFELTAASDPPTTLSRDKSPIIRYSNPVRNFFSDGAIFLWRRGPEPMVLGALSVRGNGKVFFEMTALTSSSLECNLGLAKPWTPQRQKAADQAIKAPAGMSTDPRRRTIAMRQLGRRFAIWMSEVQDPNQKKPLRLLSQPLVSWEDKENESFGACFGFAESNDPEALLVLRYQKSGDRDGEWTYTLSRMTSRPLEFQLDGETVYEVPAYWKSPMSNKDGYLERYFGEYQAE